MLRAVSAAQRTVVLKGALWSFYVNNNKNIQFHLCVHGGPRIRAQGQIKTGTQMEKHSSTTLLMVKNSTRNLKKEIEL